MIHNLSDFEDLVLFLAFPEEQEKKDAWGGMTRKQPLF